MQKIFFKFLGKTVRKKRKEKNISLDQMASLLNIGKNSYMNVESGCSFMSKENLFKLSDILKISPEAILKEALEEFTNTIPYNETSKDIYEFTNSFIEEVKKENTEEITNRAQTVTDNLYNAVFLIEKTVSGFPFLKEKERYDIVKLLSTVAIERIKQIEGE